jgi:hypothetical protein
MVRHVLIGLDILRSRTFLMKIPELGLAEADRDRDRNRDSGKQ